MPQTYTLEQLQKLGAKPTVATTPTPPSGSYSLAELMELGAKPVTDQSQMIEPPGIPAPEPPPVNIRDEGDTGIWAGLKRGLSNINPANLINPELPTNRVEPVMAGASQFQQGIQQAVEHPFRTAISSIPVVGPMISGGI